ncbi:MAG: type II secretion system GspH family protein, partial [Campylobacterales bacterium]|nr:type II secretion system GspH family protein [Campylobacterales bacterium]
MIKRGFTIIELIFVIILVGILSSVALSTVQTQNKLLVATEQIIRHINYTKHLAMTDDKFTPVQIKEDGDGDNDLDDQRKGSQFWYKKNWQILFGYKSVDGNREYFYSIFSDRPTDNDTNGEYTGTPSSNEVAFDPHENNKMSAHSNVNDENIIMNLTRTYGIQEHIGFSKGCDSNRRKIMFDSFGRPYNG